MSPCSVYGLATARAAGSFAAASDDFCLPTPLPKYVGADEGERREGDGDGEKNAARPEAEWESEDIGKRNLPEPEYEEIDDRRRPRVTRAVERLRDDHAACVEEKTAGDDPQSLRAVAVHFRAGGGLREDTHNLVGEDNKEQPHDPEEAHVIKARAPDSPLGTLRFPRAECLADYGGRRVRQTKRGQQCEHDDAQADGVACQRRIAET